MNRYEPRIPQALAVGVCQLYLRGKYEAYKTAAQMAEKHFENPLNL